MFYYLSQFRDIFFGFNIFRYITFRAGMAAVTTFLLCIIFAPFFIKQLKRWKIREVSRRKHCSNLEKFQKSKEGTPTMGGLFIIGSILISVFLWADLSNRYILLTIITAVWLAILGFVDDYVKLTIRSKRGISSHTKIIWQIILGFFIGTYVYFNPDTSTQLSLPFLKNTVLTLGVFYIPFVALVLIGSSNAVNLTDGLDGLAIGCVLIVSITLGMLSYITGHIVMSEYLFIPFVSGAGELSVFCAAIMGASLGFLWFNCYPATVFMGDVGSLSLGGTLGVIAVMIKKELLLVIIGGIFVIEALSVIIQVTSFKLRGKRVFKMAPLHHHLQLSGWKESRIIIRFWIIAIILAMVALTTLKIR
ncbi:Phospho-N-acetylmuramoyl-pentapeptide-transferase [hydrothermal vent metagenome]|uniref:Phospho-N-acetylmuramoyl-pentapeptide-transferase n=1 Tax=hydrothermal vent metagenome TaxID=652676 RepID=A0A3B1DGY0_9ZZZZ